MLWKAGIRNSDWYYVAVGPSKDRCGSAVGTPGLGERAGSFSVGLASSQDAADFDLDGQVAGRPDVEAACGVKADSGHH